MNYFFSPKYNAFYPVQLRGIYENAGSLPDDLITVTDDMFIEYSSSPPGGKRRVAGNDGYPAWADTVPPTYEELVSAAEEERQQRLTHVDNVILDWRTELMLGEISEAKRAKLSEWLAYKNDVKLVDVTINPEKVSWPALPEV